MTRTERLLQLMQILRRHRYPLTGAELARELGISLRSIYRDIATLQQQGARIEGEAGLGYVLQPGFTLPPLMFSVEEIEAITLGSRWVAERADHQLAMAARDALAKIAAVLPAASRHELDSSGLMIGPTTQQLSDNGQLKQIRQAIRQQQKIHIEYHDERGQISQRLIWPCALAFFDHVRVIVAWCELREDFRHFRTDRIQAIQMTNQSYPESRLGLLKQWRQQEGIPAP
ncbi:helix-turn-helix transcriptional regulator [Undibacterium sp. SXout7W]|uniref:helix-turn-helix transcriptional regulator n=1 Tax=Undibacterium sp. SXout7W TaxID=3413049 RepID=UPI003BEF8B00